MPTRTILPYACCLSLLLWIPASAAEYSLNEANGLPESGLSAAVAEAVNPQGYEIAGQKGPLAKIWLAKSAALKADFKPTLSVKYPFESGEFLGALQVLEGEKFTDFRGQRVKPGVYTLRYGKQPVDGNHVGTSELHDFVLALPAEMDASPEPIGKPKDLAKKSAKSVSSNHPAIFALRPADEPPEQAELVHEEADDFWILHVAASGKVNDETKTIPMRLIVIGETKEF